MMENKIKRKFNKESYDSSKHAENRIIGQLKEFFKVENLGDTYEEDLRIYDKTSGEYLANADIEVRLKWKEKVFPFYSVHIPMRKKKFINSNRPFFYFVVNGDGTDCLVTTSKQILRSKVITLKLHYDYGDVEEEFFDVPLVLWKQGFSQLPAYLEEKISSFIQEKGQSKIINYYN